MSARWFHVFPQPPSSGVSKLKKESARPSAALSGLVARTAGQLGLVARAAGRDITSPCRSPYLGRLRGSSSILKIIALAEGTGCGSDRNAGLCEEIGAGGAGAGA